MQSKWPFGDLTPFSFSMIMVDPPWSFDNWSAAGEKKNAKAHYSCMKIGEIAALPVGDLASPNAVCMLWATNPLLPEAISVLEKWGFIFKTAGHWVKKTKHGKTAFGPGYLLRAAGEPFLIGTVGKPKTTNSCRSIIEGKVREHSAKPEEAFQFAEALMPDARRVELFSRRNRPGWSAWGNEVGKFDGEISR